MKLIKPFFSGSLVLGLVLAASPAFAQGGAGGAGSSTGAIGQALKKSLANQTMAGPGAIQGSFFKGLQSKLTKNLGAKTGTKMMSNLKSQSLSASTVTQMMNGTVTKSQMKKWFGANRSQVSQVSQSISGAVSQKNRNGYFGMLMKVMTKDFGVDPTSDFAAHAASAKQVITKSMFGKLRTGTVSTKTVQKAFSFKSKHDAKFMQKILNGLKSSPYPQHPMMKSLGMGQSGKYNAAKFPKLNKSNPGAGMKPSQGAGGFACNFKLPPCPFFSGSFSKLMAKVKAGVGAGGAGGTPPGGTPPAGTPPTKPPHKGKKPKKGKTPPKPKGK